MHVHEFVDEGLGHSSYVVDLGDGTAAFIDPPRFPIAHEALVDRSGWHLAWTIDTHRGVNDGEHVQLAAGTTLRVIATPGHTPDHHAYLPGSSSNALRPVFVFVLGPDQDRAEVVRQCLDVGHENLIGELHAGITAWTASGRDIATIEVVNTIDVVGGDLIDVRQSDEYVAGHVPSARNIELGSIAATPPRSGRPVTVMCGHGERAMSAAGMLTARGITARVFDGGPDTWAATTGRQLTVGA